MKNSRKSNAIIFSLFTFLNSCSTSSFTVTNQDEDRTELLVSPDRILLTCPEGSKEDDIYMFVMPVLDTNNQVLLVIQSTNLEKKYCEWRNDKMRKILEHGSKIYIGGMGDLNPPKKYEKESYMFPGHGTFHTNGKSLQFMVIANEYGDCFSAFSEDKKPCPRDEFPIKDNP